MLNCTFGGPFFSSARTSELNPTRFIKLLEGESSAFIFSLCKVALISACFSSKLYTLSGGIENAPVTSFVRRDVRDVINKSQFRQTLNKDLQQPSPHERAPNFSDRRRMRARSPCVNRWVASADIK